MYLDRCLHFLYSLYKKKVQAGFWPQRFFTHRQRRFIMKHLKRWLALMVAAALAISLLTGCCTGGYKLQPSA